MSEPAGVDRLQEAEVIPLLHLVGTRHGDIRPEAGNHLGLRFLLVTPQGEVRRSTVLVDVFLVHFRHFVTRPREAVGVLVALGEGRVSGKRRDSHAETHRCQSRLELASRELAHLHVIDEPFHVLSGFHLTLFSNVLLCCRDLPCTRDTIVARAETDNADSDGPS